MGSNDDARKYSHLSRLLFRKFAIVKHMYAVMPSVRFIQNAFSIWHKKIGVLYCYSQNMYFAIFWYNEFQIYIALII